MRGKGWGRKHSVVDYVFKNSYLKLYTYHLLILTEMLNHGYKFDRMWLNVEYRGKNIGSVSFDDLPNINIDIKYIYYKEHNNYYLKECVENLTNKGITL